MLKCIDKKYLAVCVKMSIASENSGHRYRIESVDHNGELEILNNTSNSFDLRFFINDGPVGELRSGYFIYSAEITAIDK